MGGSLELFGGECGRLGVRIDDAVQLDAIVDWIARVTGETPDGIRIVAGAMPGGTMGNGQPGPGLYCAVIVKRVDERTRSKTSINELLRD